MTLPEVQTTSPWCQRWTYRRHSWRHRSEGGFTAASYRVEPISEAHAKSYVLAHHYSASYPATVRRYGLFDGGDELVGACVFGVPMSAAVVTNVFPDLEPFVESIELSRLVLADHVPGNGESWFLARVFEAELAAGVRGVVTFADPVPRQVAGQVVFPGHIGCIYQASNAVYLGRGTARTLTMLPDGQVLSSRSAQKVRQQERGHGHVERRLVDLGARLRRANELPAVWLGEALGQVGAIRLRHRGNHRYAFALGSSARHRARVRIGIPAGNYPKTVDGRDPALWEDFA